MTGGIWEGVTMEKDGDSEEDTDEEVVKQVVKRRFEDSSRHSPYFIPLSLLPLHHLLTILTPSSLSFSLYSFLPALFLIPVSCAFQHLANLSFSHLH
jgi:hypothetical protein